MEFLAPCSWFLPGLFDHLGSELEDARSFPLSLKCMEGNKGKEKSREPYLGRA